MRPSDSRNADRVYAEIVRSLAAHGRDVVANFDGRALTVDGGALWLRERGPAAIHRVLRESSQCGAQGTFGPVARHAACIRAALSYEDLNESRRQAMPVL